jgi:Holliday junction DNA helicase RuvA
MISYLSGEIIHLESNKITLLTNGGVWYDVSISSISFLDLSLNMEKSFYIYHHITEGNQSLFWFLEKSEKQIFEELIKISWVGWKVAIQILSLWENNLISAIKNEDKKLIESIKWIGKKMVEKIILELRDKDFIKMKPHPNPLLRGEGTEHIIERKLEQDLFSTLSNMWYDKRNIEQAMSKIPEDLKTMEEILPALIKEM